MSTAAPARAAALVIAGGVLLGSAGTAAAYAPEGASASALGSLRLLVGAGALLLVLPLVGGTCRALPALLRRWPVWVMAVFSAAYQPLFFEAVRRAGVGTSTLVAVGAVPIFAGLLGWAVLHQRPTRTWVAATLIAVLGLVLRTWGDVQLSSLVGLLMATVAAAGVGCYLVAAKIELDRGAHPVELPATAYGLGSLLLLPLLLAQPLSWLASPSGVAVALYLGVATMALGNVFSIRGMRSLHAGPAATLLLADPLTATVLGVVLLGETLDALAVLGLLLVLVGLVLQVRATRPSGGSGEDAAAVPPLPQQL
jgi:DME family drug/metabolite transporter